MEAIVVSFLFLTQYSLSTYAHWDYDHVNHWVDDYAMCGAQDQSPINIQTSQTIDSMCDPFFNWTIDFTKTTFEISNNGHAVILKAAEAANIDPEFIIELDSWFTNERERYVTLSLNENTIARFPNYFKPNGSEHDTFCLDSIHFHWGTNDWTGSEHLVNDYQYPLEAQFVHYSCNHASLGSTMENFRTEDDVFEEIENGEDIHQIATVAILFEVVDDRTNPAFDRIFDDLHLYHVKYPRDILGIQTAEIVKSLNLNDLMPDDIKTAGYYAYEGSLTTPPCTDIVRWFVMNAKGYIGRSQLAKFRELMSTINHTIAPNFRTPQGNINLVYSCMVPDTTTTTTTTTSTSSTTGLVYEIIHATIGNTNGLQIIPHNMNSESSNSVFIIGVSSCILLSLTLIVCTFMYLKAYRNNQKNDKLEETPLAKVPSTKVDAKNIEIAKVPQLPSDQTSNTLTTAGIADDANHPKNDHEQILKIILSCIELEKKENRLSVGIDDNPAIVKFDENDNTKLEEANTASLQI